MKKIILKAVSLILVFMLTFTSTVLFAGASDDEPDYPCGGVIEEVDVKVVYAPLSNRVVIGGFGPVLTGTVLRITYPNGESELLTVEENSDGYYAGDFSVYIDYFGFEPVIEDYGIESKSFYITDEGKRQFGGYNGETDFVYLSLPSFADVIYLISAYCRILF